MPKLTVDGIEIEVEAGVNVLQACEMAGVEIPRFCYHERLSIAGNCRMCLVEIEKSPKPVASCAMPAADGMVVHTATPMVRKAREGVMEFLLINHPLDCPICDQGGECDLQDQAMAYGRDGSRYELNKRAVTDKYMGPLIKTQMTRCIHCTRCIRFIAEVAGVEEIGATGRGEEMEITTYLEKSVSSEVSGNVIDLCPVGALTSKPYAFQARPWELRKTNGIDAMDAVGSNIRVDSREWEVMRILPRTHEDVNEEWLSDRSRFVWDGLRSQRLDTPYVRRDGKLRPASWAEAFDAIAARVRGLAPERMAAIAGDLPCTESMKALKDLMSALGSPNLDCRQDGAALDPSCRAGYLFNSTIAGIERADAILLVGTNPRWEAPLVNTRIRKTWWNGLKPGHIGLIGPQLDLTYPYEYLGAGTQTLSDLAGGGHSFANVLRDAERPMVILGMGALARPDGAAILHRVRGMAEEFGMAGEGWNGFNVLHTAAARVAGLDLGFVPGAGGRDIHGILDGAQSGELDLVYLLHADELEMSRLGKAFVVYQGSHGDAGAHRADVILPGSAYTEKDSTWVNLEGRVQIADRASFAPGQAREDWAIIRALSDVLGHRLPYDSLMQLRAKMIGAVPRLGRVDHIEPAAWGPFGAEGALGGEPFVLPIKDFYLTNPIARASGTMAECSALALAAHAEATGTHG